MNISSAKRSEYLVPGTQAIGDLALVRWKMDKYQVQVCHLIHTIIVMIMGLLLNTNMMIICGANDIKIN